ncbi:hypothetical protein I215_10655 [Galbibacter marinus]|uniref:Uncharacterized protein n=1 Tax=Galbibacter marinus TaxID=555500 RepID=K2Q1R6_9FLAO|nr:hypothetical protein [Galbibacter marinus]EKF54761.1 hypothetical protein I215_10655 [Galbibacter marinus]
MWSRVNIEEKLKIFRDKNHRGEQLLKEVYEILNRQSNIQQELQSPTKGYNEFHFEILDHSRIYHIEHIKAICIAYRLRFLSSKYFKGKYPKKALEAVKKLEDEHQIKLQGFKIVAPSKLFKLENADDPLLFAPMGNDYFYLIHKWGKDLHPFRKYLVLPFKSFLHLAITVIALSWIVANLIPLELFTPEQGSSYFWILFLFVFKMIGTITIFYAVALGKNFNPAIWNSKYYNS